MRLRAPINRWAVPLSSLQVADSMRTGSLTAAIFDVDGVLLASPHEQAWRDALVGFADPARFTTAMYQARVAGKPRLDGALAALEALGIPDTDQHVAAYAERKQARLEQLIKGGHVKAFPDALCIVVKERQRHAAADPPL